MVGDADAGGGSAVTVGLCDDEVQYPYSAADVPAEWTQEMRGEAPPSCFLRIPVPADRSLGWNVAPPLYIEIRPSDP